MSETQQSVAQWCTETFGPAASNMRIATRANEEMSELLALLAADDNAMKAGEEAADVVICLMRLAEGLGIDLNHEINRKMKINRARKWALTGDGRGYHVPEQAA